MFASDEDLPGTIKGKDMPDILKTFYLLELK